MSKSVISKNDIKYSLDTAETEGNQNHRHMNEDDIIEGLNDLWKRKENVILLF